MWVQQRCPSNFSCCTQSLHPLYSLIIGQVDRSLAAQCSPSISASIMKQHQRQPHAAWEADEKMQASLWSSSAVCDEMIKFILFPYSPRRTPASSFTLSNPLLTFFSNPLSLRWTREHRQATSDGHLSSQLTRKSPNIPSAAVRQEDGRPDCCQRHDC